MRTPLRRAALAAAAAAAVLLPATPAQAIFNGLPAAEGEFPFMAALLRADQPGNAYDTRFCGGSLIERGWILTAAHCLEGLTPQQITVVIGRTRLTSSAGEVRAVSSIVRHPQYTQTWDNTPDHDVALLKLSTPSTITPIRMAFTNNRNTWLPGSGVTTLGWGATTWIGGPVSGSPGGYPDVLQARGLLIADDAAARNTFPTYRAETMLTAGVAGAGISGICSGDSGGPLIAFGQGTSRLVGVTSFSRRHQCGLAITGSGFARVGEGPLSRWIIEQVPTLASDGWMSRSGDFNGDGKDDIVAFVRGMVKPGDTGNYSVWVALSNPSGTGPFGTPTRWASSFADTDQFPLVGDFNGDRRDDIVVFTRSTTHAARVALSTGTEFAPSQVWHTWFTPNDEIPTVGDVNGDGKDDVVAFPRGSAGDAWVALSNGSAFGAATFWGNGYARYNEIPALADVNGDGRADAITFTRGNQGDVFVALSNATRFGAPQRWHADFCFGSEIPAVGDFNGDRKADIATFTRGDQADVFVALSNGSSLNLFQPEPRGARAPRPTLRSTAPQGEVETGSFIGTAAVWNTDFAAYNEIPGVGDVNGDGMDDITTFTRGDTADVYVSRSNGQRFTDIHLKWHDWMVAGGEVPAGGSTW
ncbi:trypsin-like serine protease [Plantactinospora sp. ZYX-F-223]|uniref:trypsin-like serine protease n=1 Tax=Plantactinospora sp. ZYX-F-223 TaxID=3144103 RepID=UPI0031FC1800